MSDREQRSLRGPVSSVISETFEWDHEVESVSRKSSRREELTFSPGGNLLETVFQYQDGPIQRSVRVYDEEGRLRTTKWRDSDGTEHSVETKYDEYGQAIRGDAEVTYSFENGCRVRTEVFTANAPGVIAGFDDSRSPSSWIGNAAVAVAATFYDSGGRPAEMIAYDAEHVQILKVVRTYDERGRVIREESDASSPRLFARQSGTQGTEIPEEVMQLFARAFSQRPMGVSYKYDDQDRVIEQTNEMSLFGYEKTVSLYNEHGDLSRQWHYSTRQELRVEEGGEILAPPATPEKLDSETIFSYQYDERGNWIRKEISIAHHGGSRWESVEKRAVRYE
jgi:hypothetical protein